MARLASIVLDAAQAGDAAASSILDQGANQLACTTASAARQLGLTAVRVPVAVAGGVLLNNAAYRDRVLGALELWQVLPDPVTVVHEPAEGALRLVMVPSL